MKISNTVTINKNDAYNYFHSHCNKEQDTCCIERYILSAYKNGSEECEFEIFKNKDNTKYLKKKR
jgi:hypothetical protein